MKDFLNKMSRTASTAANKAGSKANELIEIGKLKAKIGSQKQDIAEAKRDIGEYCYGLFKDQKLEDEKIKEFCEKISSCEAAIADLQKQIDAVKDDYNTETCEENGSAE